MDTMPPALGGVTLTQLAYAVAIDAHRHFGHAASACHVTQPTLSMQLRKLERALGVTLFDRRRTPVVPTEVGERVIEQARAVLREAARLGDLIDGAGAEVAGQLRLGVIPTLAPYLLPRAIRELARRHPRLELVVEEYVTDDLVARVRRSGLDAGLVASPVASADVAERVLFTEPFVGYLGPAHRLSGAAAITPGDLSLDDLWLLSDGHCLRAQAVALCNRRPARGGRSGAACTTSARFESGNLETLKRLVEQNVGMTLLPALAAADLQTDEQRRLLRPFAEPAPSRDVRLIQRREQSKQRLVDATIDVLLASLPDSVRPTRARRPSAPGRTGGS